MIVIGYSGHAFVAIGILSASGKKVTGYCDTAEKAFNPFQLPFLGSEATEENKALISKTDFFISIGDNGIRKKVYDQFASVQRYPVNAVHPSAIIDASVVMGMYGIMVGAGVCINPLAEVRDGAICNTGCIIEHECVVGRFAHIGPGAVLCGNVTVGDGSYVGAGAVVRQGVKIGSQAMIGAGAVVLKDVADGETVVGNPSRILNR